MDILLLIVFCFLFTSSVCAIVYYGAFRKSTQKKPSFKNRWDKPTTYPDFAMLKVRDDRKMGDRGTDYIVFYNPNTEDISRTLKLDRNIHAKRRQSTESDLDFSKISTWVGLILFFSFIIVIATKAGYWLSEVYNWFK